MPWLAHLTTVLHCMPVGGCEGVHVCTLACWCIYMGVGAHPWVGMHV